MKLLRWLGFEPPCPCPDDHKPSLRDMRHGSEMRAKDVFIASLSARLAAASEVLGNAAEKGKACPRCAALVGDLSPGWEAVVEAGVAVLADRAYRTALCKGFHPGPPDLPRMLMLIVSECGEAIEADRSQSGASAHMPSVSAIAEELADVVIRACDTAEAIGVRLGRAVVLKMRYNESRPAKHGKQY